MTSWNFLVRPSIATFIFYIPMHYSSSKVATIKASFSYSSLLYRQRQMVLAIHQMYQGCHVLYVHVIVVS